MPLPMIQGEALIAGKDGASLRHTKSNQAVSNARLKFSDRRRMEDGTWEDSRVLWIDATAWGDMAELLAEHGTSGAVVYVAGKIETQEWEDKETGQKRSKPNLVVESVLPKPQRQRQGQGAGGQQGGGWGAQPSQGGPWGAQEPAQGGWDTPQDQGGGPPF